MNKKNRLTLSIIGVLFISLSLSASDYLNVKMRFFQGARKGEISPPEFVTSSFLQPTISATIPSKFLLEEEKSKIQNVFNLAWIIHKSRLQQMRGAGYEAVVLHRKYPATMQIL